MIPDSMARYLRALNPFMRILDGYPPSTPETERILRCADHPTPDQQKEIDAFVEAYNAKFKPSRYQDTTQPLKSP